MAEAATDRGPEDTVEDVDDFLKKCVKRFNRCEAAEQENRSNAVDDLKFKSGDQWPDGIKAQRSAEKRPCLTINKVKTFVHQITNDQRQNRPAINVSPVGDKADPETAKMLKGLIRQIERQSNADVAYDTGFDNAVSGGWGYWRVLTDYESENSFDQVIKIGQLRNQFRVYADPDHEEPDASDMQWCFISDMIPRETFKEEWPEADEIAWGEGTLGDEYKSWSTQTHIRIAEYFYFETETKTLVGLSTGQVGFDDQPEIKALIDLKVEVTSEREVQSKKIKWCKLTAHEILEESEWLGKWIPIVKVVGDVVDVEGKVQYAGLVRDMKDPQRMYNYWRTHQTELIALQPKAPFIMEEGQAEGHEQRWKEANTKSLPYLLYKGTSISGKPAPPPQRQPMPSIPLGVTQATIDSAQDMQAVSGVRFDATLNERMHDESGKALRELKRVGDLGNFHYVDNLSRSLRHTGRILIDLIPKVYDSRRVLTILREDDSEQTAIIDPSLQQPYQKAQSPDGKVQRLYNPKLGEYEVAVTIGPSYATKRQEASDGMIDFLKILGPNLAPMAADLIAKNQDWPGADELAARLASQLPPGMQDKSLEDLPPEAKGMIGQLKQQLQQLKQERDKAVSMLGEKDKDRAIETDKINKDFEAKMTDIAAGMQETIIKVQAQGQDNNQAAMEKVSKDFEAKTMQMLLDFKAQMSELEHKRIMDQAKLEQDRLNAERDRELARSNSEADRQLSADEIAAGVMVDGKKIDSGKQKSAAPVMNFYIGSGKKKLSKSKDGSYISEEI